MTVVPTFQGLTASRDTSTDRITTLELALLALSLVAGMLRIWQMSGQELPAISMDEISAVQDLKAALRRLHLPNVHAAAAAQRQQLGQ